MSMNLINDIHRCWLDSDSSDLRMFKARFVFDEEFVGFKGHFEDNPVLPGVCKIISAVEVIKKWQGRENIQLKEINLAKFFMPVTVNDELTFNCFDNESSECLYINVKIKRGDEKVSELKLKF